MEAARSAREGHVPVGRTRLFYREIGDGEPLVVLHGGPDFDHTYLFPELDRLAASLRLVAYDQRGRGRSAGGVQPADVTLDSELADLDAVRTHFGLERIAVLGHSFGGLLAAEYALRHPDRVSKLVFLNTAPLSHGDLLLLRIGLERRRPAEDVETMRTLRSTDVYRSGDLDADADYHRIHFKAGIRGTEHLERIVGRLREHFTPETVVLARAIEERLYEQTWDAPGYDLLPELGALGVPALVLHGADDLVPVAVAEHVAASIPGAVLTVLPNCGHFSHLEHPDEVHRRVAAFVCSPG